MPNDSVRNLFNAPSERRGLAESMVSFGLRRGRIALVTACYTTWIIACCTGPIVDAGMWLGPSVVQSVKLVFPAWLGPIFSMAIASMIIAFWFKQTRKVLDSPAWLVGLASIMTLASAMHLLWALDHTSSPLTNGMLYLAMSILVGVGSALFRVEIDRVFGWIGTQQTLCIGMVGTILGIAILAVCSVVVEQATEPIVLYGVSLMLPLAMAVLMRRIVHDFPRVRYFSHGKNVDLPFPAKFVVTSGVQGVAAGVLYTGLFLYGQAHLSGSVDAMFGQVIAAVLLFVTLVFLRIDFNRLIYKVAFPFIAAGFVLIAIAPNMQSGALIVLAAGFCYLDLVLWSLGACLMKNMGLPATWIASCPGAALFSGTVFGWLIATVFLASRPLGQIAVFASLVGCFLLAVALLLSSGSNLKHGWGTVRPGEGGLEMGDMAGVVRFVATERELTQRESEVMLLLVHGRTRRAICEELTVSPDTVKTHVRAIYRKTNVHSQQELIDFVARERERLAPEEEASVLFD